MTEFGSCELLWHCHAPGIEPVEEPRRLLTLLENNPEKLINFINNTHKSRVFTESKLESASDLLSSGYSRSEVAEKLAVKYSTLNKAVNDGRIKIVQPVQLLPVSDKSSRSLIDYNAGKGIGVACTRSAERTWASLGLLNLAESRFEHCNDVPNGGVDTALPALIITGLYHKIDECFSEFKGYYSITHIMTLLAFMALCRIKTVEQLRWQSPGELSKLFGLDRIPEVRWMSVGSSQGYFILMVMSDYMEEKKNYRSNMYHASVSASEE
jgi:Transposase protein